MVDRIGGYIIDEEKLVSISKKIKKIKKILDKLKNFSSEEISSIEIQNKCNGEYDENGENLTNQLYIDASEIPEMPDIVRDAIDRYECVLVSKIEELSNELIEEAKGKYTEKE